MKQNILLEKSFSFAIRIVNLSRYLTEERREYVLSKQVLRSGTSIGANAEECVAASSKKDFLYRASVAYRESRETHYWIRLLRASHYLEEKLADSLLSDCDEIIRILSSITKTTRERLENIEDTNI